MRNILLEIEYDGTDYHGWQRQKNVTTIQQLMEESIKEVVGVRTNVTGSGRTDAGVHALGQRANFKTKTKIPTDRIPLALNSYLPPDIRVIGAVEMPSNFHARYDALYKCYMYRIYNRNIPSAVYRRYSCFAPGELNIAGMKRALRYIIGKKDFSTFCNSGGFTKSRVRDVKSLKITTDGPMIDMIITADGFLYNMVRIIAGTLLEVGKGNMSPGDIKTILEARNREYAGPTLPPQGLFLCKVYYADILDTT